MKKNELSDENLSKVTGGDRGLTGAIPITDLSGESFEYICPNPNCNKAIKKKDIIKVSGSQWKCPICNQSNSGWKYNG